MDHDRHGNPVVYCVLDRSRQRSDGGAWRVACYLASEKAAAHAARLGESAYVSCTMLRREDYALLRDAS